MLAPLMGDADRVTTRALVTRVRRLPERTQDALSIKAGLVEEDGIKSIEEFVVIEHDGRDGLAGESCSFHQSLGIPGRFKALAAGKASRC